MSLINNMPSLSKITPWIITAICVFLLILRSTYFGIEFVYRLKLDLMVDEFYRRARGLPARPYPKVIPRFPKTIVVVMIVSIVWGSLGWLKYSKIPAATPAITQSTTVRSTAPTVAPTSAISAVTTNSELYLRVRSAPYTSSSVIGRYAPNTEFVVECFADGTEVSEGVKTSSVWYKVYKHDAWVSSIYVSTNIAVPHC